MRSLVRHYRNHPSVIMWSIGNEMPDQTTDQGVIIARNLTAYCHDEDPTRPTSLGCNKRDAVFRDIVNQVDIFGLNYFHKLIRFSKSRILLAVIMPVKLLLQRVLVENISSR